MTLEIRQMLQKPQHRAERNGVSERPSYATQVSMGKLSCKQGQIAAAVLPCMTVSMPAQVSLSKFKTSAAVPARGSGMSARSAVSNCDNDGFA